MLHRFARRALLLVLLLLLLCPLLSGCQAIYTKSDMTVSDWSRGVRTGQAALNDQPAMSLIADNQVLLCWVASGSEPSTYILRLIQIDGGGETVLDRDLAIDVVSAAAVRLTRDGQDTLHLTWVDRQYNTRSLFHVRISPQGDVLDLPKMLSLPKTPVRSYSTVATPSGMEVVWTSDGGESEGMYHASVTSSGEIALFSKQLRSSGYDAQLRFDGDGRLHIIWLEQPSFGERELFHALFSLEEQALRDVHRLTRYPAPSGVVSRSPEFAITEDYGYVFWSLERRGGGMTPPSADLFYVAFPVSEPRRATQPIQVHIASTKEPIYLTTETAYPVTQLADAAMGSLPSSFCYMPAAATSRDGDLAVLYSVELAGRNTQIIQVVLSIWRDGKLDGYQVIGQTRSSSLKPVLRLADDNQLHAVWIDTAGFGQYDVYYASTVPAIRQKMNRRTFSDVGLSVLDALWGVVQAMSFLPLVLMWALFPTMVLAVYIFIHPEGTFDYAINRVMLVISILIYTLFKYALRSGWLLDLRLPRGLPFGATNIILLAAPICITCLAGLVTWLIMRKREASILPTFGIFVAIDAVATLLIYVPGVLAD